MTVIELCGPENGSNRCFYCVANFKKEIHNIVCKLILLVKTAEKCPLEEFRKSDPSKSG